MQPCVKSVQNYLTLKQNRKPLILSICLGILDNVLKSHIRSQNYEDFVILENILEIDLNFNTGIAFGLLKGKAEFTFLLSSLVLIWLIFQFKNTFANKTRFEKEFRNWTNYYSENIFWIHLKTWISKTKWYCILFLIDKIRSAKFYFHREMPYVTL